MRAASPHVEITALASAALLALMLAGVACSAPASTDVAVVEASLEAGALEDHLSPTLPPTYLPAGAAVVFDRRDDGATLGGVPERALFDSDPERVVVLAAGSGGAALAGTLDAERVLDARFSGDAVVALGADHVLRVYRQGRVTVLDEAVEAPLSVVGTNVAYARGEMPSFELARAEVTEGVAHAVTIAMAPVWSPALSPDGHEIVFVSGRTGAPRLYRVSESGTPALLRDVGVFPSSPRAPRWHTGDRLSFEDERGAPYVLDLITSDLVTFDLPTSDFGTSDLRAGALVP